MIDLRTTIRAESILTTSIQISWSEASCLGTCLDGITGYSYKLQQNGNEIESGTTSTNERTVTIVGLTLCTVYEFIVAGISGSVTGNQGLEYVTTAGEG